MLRKMRGATFKQILGDLGGFALFIVAWNVTTLILGLFWRFFILQHRPSRETLDAVLPVLVIAAFGPAVVASNWLYRRISKALTHNVASAGK